MVKDLLSLFLAFIRNNWKILFVSTIGLTLALATVAETNVIVTFYRQSLFEDFLLTSSYGTNTDFIVKIGTQFADINTFQSKLQETINITRSLGQNTAEKLAFSNLIERELWHLTVETEFYSNYSNDLGRMEDFGPIETLDNDTLQIYKNFLTSGELPQGPNETIVLIDEYTREKHNLQIGDAVQLSLPRIFYWEVNPIATAIISGIIEYKPEDRWFIPSNTSRNTLWDYNNEFYNTLFITNQDNFVDFITTICENSTVPLVILDKINIDLGQLDSFNLGNELTRFERFSQQLQLECNLQYSNFYVSSSIILKIQSFEFQFGATLLIMWLFSIPTIIATLFLANFSLNLLRGRKKHQIAILKTRGASSRQILAVLLGEFIITTLLSIGLGYILGFPFAFLAVQNDRFLNFAGGLLSFNSLMSIFQPAIFFGILFALLLNLRSIFRMARMDINESLLSQEPRRPLWKKFYLDVILLGAGLLGVLIIVLLTNLTSVTPSSFDPEMIVIYSLLSFVALFFGLPSPILIAVGGGMLVARFLPILLRNAARWTWKFEGGIIAFSFRNVLHRLSHASRAALLISIVIAFSIAFISIPYNADKNIMDHTYYHNLGADMVITVTADYNETLAFNHTLMHYLQNNLTGVASVSPVAQASGNVSSGSINVLGVDVNTYAQTAFFREDFLNQDAISSVLRLDMIGAFKALMQGDWFPDTPDLNSLISRLHSNTTFLLQEDNLRSQNVNVGEQISLLFLTFNETSLLHDYERYDFDIAGTFKAWPLFISYPISPGLFGGLYLIGNFSTVLDYANATLFEVSTFNYLIRVNPGVSKSQLRDQILNETGFEAETIDGYMERYLNSPTRNVLMTTLSSSFFMLIIVSLFTILMFSSSQLMERGKEIGIERVLGMSFRQISLLFVIEALIIVLFGTMVGIILGITIVQVFLSTTMIAQAYLYPPFVLNYPLDLFAGIATLILAVGIISSLIPAYLAIRTKISNILRTE